MGTRNLIEVKLNGELKVAQYGQWDGYPTGQGAGIATFIQEDMDKDKFVKALENNTFLTEEEIDEIDALGNNWQEEWPWLSRDVGSDILKMVQDHDGLKVADSSEFKEDTLFCEYHYLIDMDNETVTINEAVTIPFNEFTVEAMRNLEESEALYG